MANMKDSVKVAIACVLAVGCVALGARPAIADTLDPLLQLLVDKGLITLEEARAVQSEYDAEQRPAAPAQKDAASQAPTRPPAPAPTEPQRPSWTDRIELFGDLRLRYEGFNWSGHYNDDRRDRFRYRLRAGLKATITDELSLGVAVRSGNPDNPVSDNQSLDGGLNKTRLSIAEANLRWAPSKRFDVHAGKFSPKKLWHVSDLQWDDDVVVEGLLERVHLGTSGGAYAGTELVAYQYVLNESSSSDDAFVLGGQIRPQWQLGENAALTIGAGYDHYDNPQQVADLTLSGALGGNDMTNLVGDSGLLVSDFRVANVFGQWSHTSSELWPVRVKLFGYSNLGAEGPGDDADTAFYGRIEIGSYKKPGRMAFRYSYYHSEADALFYAYTQSDTKRASNVTGHRLDFRLGGPKRNYLNITWYNTREQTGHDATMNRWQVDYIVRF